MSDHHHPHLYIDDTWYMITASTINHAPFLKNDQVKVLVRDTFEALIQTFDISLLAWVILDNHYHLLLKTNIGRDVSRFISRLHGSTSRQMNLQNNAVGRQVWHNYWDTCIRTEADMWTRFNYIHHNPVKQGYVRHMNDWPFSSYSYYLQEKGVEWLEDCWQIYPIIDYLVDNDFEPLSFN